MEEHNQQFAGSARRLFAAVLAHNNVTPDLSVLWLEEQQLIADFLYDFTIYIMNLVPHLINADLATVEEVVKYIPDMPEKQEHAQ